MTLDQPARWFFAGAALVVYAYVLYPVAVALLAGTRRTVRAHGQRPRSISIVVAAHNEAGTITRRLRELVSALDYCGLPGEIIVVSDGSSDDTVSLTSNFSTDRVRVVELAANVGKARALSEGCRVATGDLLVFADARQRWSQDAIAQLIEPFIDPLVGSASGELVLEPASGDLAGVGLYWRYEKWLRRNESRVHSTVGVSGSIAAVRRSLFLGVPSGTILDDVYWPLRVVMQGYRVVHVEAAVARDRLPPRRRDEFWRKVRTLSGNFQLMVLLPQALLPWRNPIWLQFVSHKLLRLVVPWALLAMLATSALSEVPAMEALFWLQAAGYSLGVVGLLVGSGTIGARLSPIASFLLLNAAAWVAFWVWISGRTSRSWTKVDYDSSPPPSR